MKTVDNCLKILSYATHDKSYLEVVLTNFEEKDWESQYASYFKLLKIYYERYQDVITYDFIENLHQKYKISNDTFIKYMALKPRLKDTKILNEADLMSAIDAKKEDILRKKYLNLVEHIIDTKDNLYEVSNVMIDKMMNIVNYVNQSSTKTNFGQNLNENTEQRFLEYTEPSMSPEKFATGFKQLDTSMAGGLVRQNLMYVMGRKGAGKSVLMLNLGYNIWKQHKNVLFITLEVSEKDYFRRLDSLASGIPIKRLKMADFATDTEKNIVKNYLETKKNNMDEEGNVINGILKIIQMNQFSTTTQINVAIDQIEKKQGLKFDAIIVDYAGIISPSVPQREERTKHKMIADELKLMAQKRNCVVISGVQMNREGSKSEFITASHTAYSDGISDSLDWGLAIMFPDNPDSQTGKIQTFKTRDGEGCYFNFNKRYDIMKIQEEEGIDTLTKEISETIQDLSTKGWGFSDED